MFLTCRTWSFSIWFHQLPGVAGPRSNSSSLTTSLLCLTYHRQPSRGPVEASRLLSVSEASVCSVDMDEMSLMDDDWEGVVLLFTAASVLRKPNIIKSEAWHCCRCRQGDVRPLCSPALLQFPPLILGLNKKLVYRTFWTSPGVFLRPGIKPSRVLPCNIPLLSLVTGHHICTYYVS